MAPEDNPADDDEHGICKSEIARLEAAIAPLGKLGNWESVTRNNGDRYWHWHGFLTDKQMQDLLYAAQQPLPAELLESVEISTDTGTFFDNLSEAAKQELADNATFHVTYPDDEVEEETEDWR